MGVPCSSSDSALQMVQSFTSPVLADPSGCLPLGPPRSCAKGIPSFRHTEDTVCGRARESRGSCARVHLRRSLFPDLLAVLSTCLASTATPASSSTIATFLEADHGPTVPIMRTTAERSDVASFQGPVAKAEAPLTFRTVVVARCSFSSPTTQ